MRYLLWSSLLLFLFSCGKETDSSSKNTAAKQISLPAKEQAAFDSLPVREQERIQNYFENSTGLASYVINDECIVYSDTALSKQIAVLTFATPVVNKLQLYENAGSIKLNGWRHKVCPIRFWNGKDSINGFALDSDISFFSAKTSDGNLILAGYNDLERTPLTGKILVIDSLKNISDKLIFEMTGEEDDGLVRYYSYYIEGNCTGKHAASGFTDVFTIFMYYPACGYTSSEQWFNYKNGELKFITECLHMGDAGAAAAWSYPIFPEEKNGKEGSVLLVNRFEEYEYDEDLQDHKAIDSDSSLVELHWDVTKGVVKTDTLYNDFDR